MDEKKVTYFAETDSRNKRVPFGIKAEDRTRHVYLIGKTGMGKSTALENMAIQDIQGGEGMAFIDPHGKTADLLLDYVPQERIKDVLYFAPFDLEHPIAFNVMEDVGYEKRHLVANGLMSAFKKIWVDAWSARMEYILNNILLALLEYPDSTLIGVNRMLADKEYRKKVVENITDPAVKSFWLDEFAKYGDRYMQEAGAAIQNKIGQFISNPVIRNIIGQPKSTFDLRKMMDERKIIIINLSKGRVGEANANLLGSMLITKIYLGAMSRADVSPGMMKKLPNFYLYVDEFQSFANESFADILSEARKYKLNLTIAHQYVEQMSEEVQAAVFGNVGTMIVFRVGALDSELFEKEFFPTFTKQDLVNLGSFQIYLKLMIDGVSSQPFSATTLPPIEKPLISFKEDIMRYTRATFARPRAQVEEGIRKWHEPLRPDDKKRIDEPRRDFDSMRKFPDAPSRTAPREVDLRKAISQNYVANAPLDQKRPEPRPEPRAESRPEPRPELRSVARPEPRSEIRPEQKPKKEKGPSPQNLNALRDALAAVVKGAMPNSQSGQERNPVQPVMPKPIINTVPKDPEPKKTEAKREEKKVEEAIKKSELKVEQETPEVPEEVLRKILEVDR
jgi:hypothetical protein